MSQKEQAVVRGRLYEVALNGVVNELGYTTETISDGALIHLGDGQYAKLVVSVCDATKFDLDGVREKYQDKLQRAADRAAKAAAAAEEKARKAEAKAAKSTNAE